MYNRFEDRIVKAVLAGSMIAGGLAVALFLLAGELVVNAATSMLDLLFAPSWPKLIFAAALAAGLLKILAREIPSMRGLFGRQA